MLQLLFPRLCNGCQRSLLQSENVLCATCAHNLPLVCHHRTGSDAMKKIFYGRLSLVEATALLQFQKRGITQELMHNLKYRGQTEIGSFFGKWLGAELAQIPSFQSIDLVIPVPLHKQKLKKRGYNQVEGFGREIAHSLGIPYRDDILHKISKTNSQVFKQRLKRFNPILTQEQIFATVTTEALNAKHVLLVDDIITTGATLENCAASLLKKHNVLLSAATIAIA